MLSFRIKQFALTALAALVISVNASGARASFIPAIDIGAPVAELASNQGNLSMGYGFTTNSQITVNALGYYNGTQKPMADSHMVGIFDNNGVLLASTTVTPAGTPQGSFLYNSITPLVLAAGQSYKIAGLTGTGDSFAMNPNPVNVDSRITLTGHLFTVSATLIAPTDTSANALNWFGPNFEIQDSGSTNGAPEPGTMALMASGMFGLFGFGVRRRFSTK